MLSKAVLKDLKRAIDAETSNEDRRQYLYWKHLCGEKHFRRRTQWMRRVVHIPDKHSNPPGMPTRFVPNKAQRHQLYLRAKCERENRPVRIATLKARQYGITTLWVICGVELVSRSENALAMIVGDVSETSQEALEKAKFICDRFPYELKRRRDNRSELAFQPPIGSRLVCSNAVKKNPGRGKTYAMIHATEPAFWTDAHIRALSLQQSVPSGPGTVLSYESTANGEGDWWHDFWWKAFDGENEFTACFYPWYYDPDFDYALPCDNNEKSIIIDTMTDEERALITRGVEFRSLKWRRYALRNLVPETLELSPEDFFNQEYPGTPEQAFLASGKPAYESALVAAVNAKQITEPIWKGEIIPGEHDPNREDQASFQLDANEGGYVWMWEPPERGRAYCMGIDAGEGGTESDWSVCVILDLETGDQVCTMRAKMDPGEFGRRCACLGWHYFSAYCLPEMKAAGLAVYEAMVAYGYYSVGMRPQFGQGGNKITNKMGWDTNVQTKGLMVMKVRQVLKLRGEGPAVRDKFLSRELRIIRRDEKGSYGAPKGKHDDYHDAWSIALWAREFALDQGVLEDAEAPPGETLEERHWQQFGRDTELGDRIAAEWAAGKNPWERGWLEDETEEDDDLLDGDDFSGDAIAL